VNKTELILSYITEHPATIRELQKMTGLHPRIISATINRMRTRGALIYIAGWQRQQTEIRCQWVARWHFGLPADADKKMPRPLSSAELWKQHAKRRKMKTRASSVFAWCSA
jgi:hypothetical protein